MSEDYIGYCSVQKLHVLLKQLDFVSFYIILLLIVVGLLHELNTENTENWKLQLLNTFYLLKDLKNRFFNENKKFLNKVMNQYILYLLHQLLALFVDF